MNQDRSFEYEGPPELLDGIERALQWVRHPLLGLNVLDAGLVYGVRANGQRVHVSMTMTAPGCRLGDLLAEDVEAELFDHLGDGRQVVVEMVWKPEWTPARMKVVPIDRQTPCQLRVNLTRINMRGPRAT
ncbi:hypothetical protein GCM10027034_08600 [Ramlibacter solisilvae]|uniref:metal-sulfur cluster assembly factor n=1 Tax=Ramlibacter tataouinensis TaxID=94132 RepID=UPI000777BB46|nr:metal-sulfur cluster assembly factor [Ramlibacter tataouinensis]